MALIPYRVRRFDERFVESTDDVADAPASTALHCHLIAAEKTNLEIVAEIISLTLFTAGAAAVGTEPAAADGLVLVAGFDSVASAEHARSVVIAEHGDLVDTITLTLHDPDTWVQAQRDGLEPTAVGDWEIRAPWHPPPSGKTDPERVVIIDPGVAFGHGAHPSTRLAIQLLLELLDDLDPPAVLDLGTGTGVVAIIAARAGARCRAVENDPAAADIAWSNIERNGVSSAVDLYVGDAAEATVEPDELVIVNVTIDIHRSIAIATQAAGHVVLSGVLAEQVDEAIGLYPGHQPSTILNDDGWAAVHLSSRRLDGRKNS